MTAYDDTTRKRLRLIRLTSAIARTRHYRLITEEEYLTMMAIVRRHIEDLHQDVQATT